MSLLLGRCCQYLKDICKNLDKNKKKRSTNDKKSEQESEELKKNQ